MDCPPLSQDEQDLLYTVFSSTLNHTMYHIVKEQVMKYRAHHDARLTEIEAHTATETKQFRGSCTAYIRLVLCKFSNVGVLGLQLERDYVHKGSFSV